MSGARVGLADGHRGPRVWARPGQQADTLPMGSGAGSSGSTASKTTSKRESVLRDRLYSGLLRSCKVQLGL